MSTIEELLDRKSSGSCLQSREYGRRDPSRWPRGTTLYPQKLAVTSPTSGGRSVGIVRSGTQTTEFFFKSINPMLKFKEKLFANIFVYPKNDWNFIQTFQIVIVSVMYRASVCRDLSAFYFKDL
jgi:hypothetical protein